MMSIGKTFREAREARGMSREEAAAATRMKVDHIQALENEDFSRFAAPVYAQGFIKLYANFLGLDPMPLLEEYRQHTAPSRISMADVAATLQRAAAQAEVEPAMDTASASPTPSEESPRAAAAPEAPSVAARSRFSLRWIATGVAVVLAILAIVYLRPAARRTQAPEGAPPPPVGESAVPPTPARQELAAPPLIELPPDPFWLDPLPTPPRTNASPTPP